MTRRPIVVIGSVNMDLVCRTPRLPGGGETVLGENLLTIPGGKGANQAVAAARLGGDVHLVGRVGDDAFGRHLADGLRENNVGTEHLARTRGAASGCAVILVDARGENSIVVSPGANAFVSPADVDAAEALLASAAVVVLQLEIPLPTVRHAVALCRRLGVPCVLDPAPVPARGLPAALYRVDILTPNEPEAAQLVGATRAAGRKGEALAATLLAKGAGRVVLKMGAGGSAMGGGDVVLLHAPAFRVKVIDTTAAGDAFTGALAVALSERRPWDEVLRFANAAGAVCCTTLGAQPSLPTRAAADALIARTAASGRGKTTPRTRRPRARG